MTEERTREQVLREAINTDAGVVRLDALVAYFEGRREACRSAVMADAADQRLCDALRGKHQLIRDILTILTTETP